MRQHFSDDLQSTVDKIPASDVMIILGDFNLHVGHREAGSDLWQGTFGDSWVGRKE